MRGESCFDPTPKVLFSPAGKVEDADLQTIANQAKSPAAEAAVKMNVFQSDNEEVAAPASHRNEIPEEETSEPTKRESTKPVTTEKDITDVVKKWSKK